MRASIYIATSLDGFIARADGGIDWLVGGSEGDGEDYGYKAFLNTVDALVMGRHTYEKVLTFEEWPYGVKPVVVLSSRPLQIPSHLSPSVEAMACSPDELVRRLSERGMGHLYIDGGRTIQGFLEAGLIQRLILTRLPVLIGAGIPLFGPVARDIRPRHVQTRSFPTGFVQSEYEILP